jgi:hypothetical protein
MRPPATHLRKVTHLFPWNGSPSAVKPEKKHLDVDAHALESQNGFNMESSRRGFVMLCHPDATICKVIDDRLGIRSRLFPAVGFTGNVLPLDSHEAARLPRNAHPHLDHREPPSLAASGVMRHCSAALSSHPTDHACLSARTAASDEAGGNPCLRPY